jgi:hypothetical protein
MIQTTIAAIAASIRARWRGHPTESPNVPMLGVMRA